MIDSWILRIFDDGWLLWQLSRFGESIKTLYLIQFQTQKLFLISVGERQEVLVDGSSLVLFRRGRQVMIFPTIFDRRVEYNYFGAVFVWPILAQISQIVWKCQSPQPMRFEGPHPSKALFLWFVVTRTQ
jgi:hypothetical protein